MGIFQPTWIDSQDPKVGKKFVLTSPGRGFADVR